MIFTRSCAVLAGVLVALTTMSADAATRGPLPQGATLVLAQATAQPEQQDEFVPISELPPQDQLPAAPLLVAAYMFVLVGLFAYLFSVTRRLTGVQRELERLESDVKQHSRQ